jgi:hypothetical protein
VSTPERAVNPFTGEVVAAPTGASSQALVQRESQEIQARMLVARNFPRDPIKAMDKIINAFTRPTLCEDAQYAYSKGGTDVQGLSIRAAEVLAQNWGNISCGVVELTRAGGQSECLAYATDLETGFHDEKRFFIKHWRDTKKGGYPITEERDIYEVVANYGARRKRACILAVIPSDVQEAAEHQIDVTLKTKIEITPDSIKAIVEKFEPLGVNKEMIEKRIQRHLEAILPAQVLTLRRIYTSLKDGMSEVGAWFEIPPPAPETGSDKPPADVPTTQTDQVKEQLRTRAGAKKPAAGETAIDEKIPFFDAAAAIAELKKAKTLAELEASKVAVWKDFEVTRRAIPIEVDDAYNMAKETLGEREGKQLEL